MTSATETSLEQRLTALEDERAVRGLVDAYAIRADLGRTDAFAELFTEDGAVDIQFGDFLPVGATPEVYEGREGVKRFVSGPVAQSLLGNCQHHVSGQLDVTVDGDSAEGYGYSFVIFREETGMVIKSANFRHWTFARTADGWRIRRVAVKPLGSSGLHEMFAGSSGGASA